MIYQVVFLLNFLVMVLLMKLVSRALAPAKTAGDWRAFLFTTPLLSYTTFCKKKQRSGPAWWLLLKFIIITFFLSLILFSARKLRASTSYSDVLLLCPMIYVFTEWMGAFGQLLFCYTSPTSPMHRHPLSSVNIREFWGRRWNVWVQDWLADMNRPLGRRPGIKLFYTFLISGLFHELMANLPHLIQTGEFTFGNMLAYFLIQALALWLDKQCLTRAPSMIRRLFLWSAVALPAPLFINRPLLLFFGIIDG